MRPYIQSKGRIPGGINFFNAYQGFTEMGLECVLFEDVETLDTSLRSDVVVGGLGVVQHALTRFGAAPGLVDYPSGALTIEWPFSSHWRLDDIDEECGDELESLEGGCIEDILVVWDALDGEEGGWVFDFPTILRLEGSDVPTMEARLAIQVPSASVPLLLSRRRSPVRIWYGPPRIRRSELRF